MAALCLSRVLIGFRPMDHAFDSASCLNTLHAAKLGRTLKSRTSNLVVIRRLAAASLMHTDKIPSPKEELPNSLLQQTLPEHFYTGMSIDQLSFWDTHDAVRQMPERRSRKGWTDHNGVDDPMRVAQTLLIANVASDRAEMHFILAQQRDNWNGLFQRTLTMVSMTAAVLAALHGHTTSLSASIPAALLNVGAAFMMSVINHFQPSQLAEEQRTASRLFKQLVNDINYALALSPDLRQDAQIFLEDCRHRLQALDTAFPLPLTPGGLEKFPAQVLPSILRKEVDFSKPEVTVSKPANGWNEQISEDLAHVSRVLQASDIKTYLMWAENVKRINKTLAIAAPLFSLSGAAFNAANAFGSTNLGVLAAVCSIVAAFLGSFSHDAQMGMILELYRNSAGFYRDVVSSIEEVGRLPVESRENGVLFQQRVAYQLGRDIQKRSSSDPTIPADAKTGGTLF